MVDWKNDFEKFIDTYGIDAFFAAIKSICISRIHKVDGPIKQLYKEIIETIEKYT